MPPDPALLAALIQALEKQPDSVSLRVHVAGLLLEAGAEATAMEHIEYVLHKNPDNREALTAAIKAAEALGDGARATLYRARLGKDDPPKSSPSAGPFVNSPREPAPALPSSTEGIEALPIGADPTGDGQWWDVERVPVTWADVGGMDAVKRRLMVSLIGPIRNPELRQAYGQSLSGGLLLYGPPGCGKTFMARATAGELQARFIAVGLADILDMWLGQSEKAVQKVFEVARRNAPCVVFFDELDAIGQKRTQLRHHAAQRGVVNQLLAEMDGFGGLNEGVFVLGATNHPWDLDSALLRPGRFDRSALVIPPDREARRSILELKFVGRPVQVDVAWLADKTDGFSGADLGFLVQVATEAAMEDSLVTGVVRTVSRPDFERALREVKPSTRAWFETARNFVLFANEGGAYDDLLMYMKEKRLV